MMIRRRLLSGLIAVAAAATVARRADAENWGGPWSPPHGPTGFPVNTKVIFPQATVPVGWVLDTSNNDKAIRIVNTVGGGTGGSSAFSTVFGKTATDAHTLTTAEIPSITPSGSVSAPTMTVKVRSNQVTSSGSWPIAMDVGSTGTDTNNIVQASAPTFTGNAFGSGGSHTHPIDIRVQYVDCVVGKKV
jgi:hypothetical protein